MFINSEYFKVAITDFNVAASLPVDLYFEPIANKIQKLASKNSSFSVRRLPAPLKKNLYWILLKKEDYRLYVDFTVGQAALPLTPKDEVQQKLKFLNQHVKNFIAQYSHLGLSTKSFELVSNTLNNVLYLVLENPVTSKLFEKVETLESNNFHSLTVAIWTHILAIHLGWSGEPTAFRVTLCALFHDVGVTENFDHLLEKKHRELSAQDRRILESHVVRGRDILSSITGMPSEVITVAYQHHEFVNGTGFPQKLYLDDIHPIARLVALTNRFYEFYSTAEENQISIIEAFQSFKKNKMNYDLRFFKALEEVLAKKEPT